jgi:hypothetical protein
MTMTEWARREVEIACKRENPNRKEGEWDYGCACYESALKAYESLIDDGHSGFSWGFTRNILMRLMDDKPLTPIEDNEEDWNESYRYDENDQVKHYQCKRMSSLFKDVYPDGTVRYSDVDRVRMYTIDEPDAPWSNGMISKMIHEMFPITMPYIPENKPYKVYVEEFLYDKKNGDWDTEGILYVLTPDGERIDIHRYFGEVDGKFVEISFEEYELRAGRLKESED